MTPKQQALEELMAVMEKWDMEIVVVSYESDLAITIDEDEIMEVEVSLTAETIQTELNRMKEDGLDT